MSKKPIFQQFIEANEAMLKCFEGIDQEQYKGKEGATAGICNSEKEAVKSILRNNSMTMTRVVKERALILHALSQEGLETKKFYDEPFEKYK